MPSNIIVNVDYDKTELLELFNTSEKSDLPDIVNSRIKVDFPTGIHTLPIFSKLIDTFHFVARHDQSIELFQIRRKTNPYVSSGFNGFVVLPISGTPLILNTYSYVSPHTTVTGRPYLDLRMPAEEAAAIEETLIDSVPINQPVAIDGLTTFSFEAVEEPFPIVLLLRIDQSWDWTTAYNFCRKML
jgi:hypothetical protein